MHLSSSVSRCAFVHFLRVPSLWANEQGTEDNSQDGTSRKSTSLDLAAIRSLANKSRSALTVTILSSVVFACVFFEKLANVRRFKRFNGSQKLASLLSILELMNLSNCCCLRHSEFRRPTAASCSRVCQDILFIISHAFNFKWVCHSFTDGGNKFLDILLISIQSLSSSFFVCSYSITVANAAQAFRHSGYGYRLVSCQKPPFQCSRLLRYANDTSARF